ncbi:MAG: ABC transporter substrate-binding protein [Nakamurella sp.]
MAPSTGTSSSAGANSQPTSTGVGIGADGPVTATDPAGKKVTLPHRPQRVVCLTGLCDDVMYTLGLNPVGTSTPALLALPQYLGAESSKIATIPGGFGTEDIESIAKLEPDLVIGLAGVHDANKAAIENFAPLIVIDVKTYRDSLAYQSFFGELTGRSAQAAAGNADFEKSMAESMAAAKAKNLQSVTALSMYWNVGTTGVNTDDDIIGSLLAEVFAYPWPNKGGDYSTQAAYSTEEILKKDPSIIFIQSYTATPTSPNGSEDLAGNPLWKRVSAVRDGKVKEVEVALWTAGRGPRALSLVLQQAVEFATS